MAAALAVPTFVCKNPHRQRPPHTQQTRVGQELLVPLPVSMFAFGLSSFVGRSPPRPNGAAPGGNQTLEIWRTQKVTAPG